MLASKSGRPTRLIWEAFSSMPGRLQLMHNTIYNFIWPRHQEGPAGRGDSARGRGAVNDFCICSRMWASPARTGQRGCKYRPDKGQITVRLDTVNPSPFRAFLLDGPRLSGVESVKRHLKIYQLSNGHESSY